MEIPETPITAIYALIVISILILMFKLVHAVYVSPLSHIPGPTICKISELPLRILNARLLRNQKIHEWHQKYGPVVLIAPGQVSFSSALVAREIYSATARHPKSSYFDNLAMYGYRSVFMAREAHEHRRLRKRISSLYQPSNVYKPATIGYIRELAERTRCQIRSQVEDDNEFVLVNIFPHCNAFSFDNITRFALGPELCSDAIRGGQEGRKMFSGWEECELWAPLGASFPMVLRLVKYYKQHIERNKSFLKGDTTLQAWTSAQLATWAETSETSRQQSASLVQQMSSFKNGDGTTIPLNEIAEEILDNFFAAQSVVTNALVFLLWDLACNPEWQRKVRSQLVAFGTIDDGSPSWADIEKATLLDACLQESSRVHPLASGRAERIVRETIAYDQTVVPAGTIVSASTKALHYSPDAFPNPHIFNPARWLEADDAQLQAMKLSFMPYGQGARICLGIPFAMAQMKHLVAFLLLSFEFLTDETSGTNMASMTQLGTQSALPRGLRCDLLVRRIDRS